MESYISKGIQTVTKKKRSKPTVRVCDRCQVPLIFTFAFPYAERYCLNCGYKGGMLGTGKDVPMTRKLRVQKRLVDAVWGVIYGKTKYGLQPSGSQRIGCKKCDGDTYHKDHLTEAETEYHDIMVEMLQNAKGMFDEKIPT